MTDIQDHSRVPAHRLRWTCDDDCLDFETTAEIEDAPEHLPQPTAKEALEFGVLSRARGQNVYVRGVRGTGRRSMVRRVLRELRGRVSGQVELRDHCYVHNFRQPDRPRLLVVGAGKGTELRRRMEEVARFVAEDLLKLLDTEALIAERRAIEARVQEQIRSITEPLERELESEGLKLVQVQQGNVQRPAIVPLVEGKPTPLQELERRVAEGELPAEVLERFREQLPQWRQRVEDVGLKVTHLQREGAETIQKEIQESARRLLTEQVARIRADYRQESLDRFLDELIDDVVENRLTAGAGLAEATRLYGVNVVHQAPLDLVPPIVEESSPTVTNLLGTVELGWTAQGPAPSDYSGIRAGALLRADGGYLVLDVYDLLTEPGAWRSLMRTLRSGQLEIVPPELTWFRSRGLLSPEPIEIDVRVILIGDARTYYLLDRGDPDFSDLFKVLADFDHEIVRNEEGARRYGGLIARMVRSEKLLPFHRDAVAALTEHGARIASRDGKLSARVGRLGDLAREADFLARRADAELVRGDHVRDAIRRTRRRASLPQRKFQELIDGGVIRIETSGQRIGQINGLAVIQAGPITYGFPARITATIGVGQAGLIDIEASANLSGSIHTKGFHILNGLLRHLLRAEHPLAFSASLAFEQSYGGIDGDSASGAETCCLLSALTGVPLSQGLAMTGAIDQFGNLQAIGGVNEKIEGFYDTCISCHSFGLTGDQGVIIPRANAGDLMLRPDVVEACAKERFHVYAVDHIGQALELFTGMPTGEWDEEAGGFPEGTLLALAVERAEQFWRRSSRPTGRRALQPPQPASAPEPPSPPESPATE